MDDSEKVNNPDEGFTGTMVDLGEDLLEATRVLNIQQAGSAMPPQEKRTEAPAAAPVDSTDDDLQKGEILMSERLFDDAKKIFRKVLRADSSNEAAKKFLDEIQKQEIQDLLGGEAPRRRLGADEAAAEDAPKRVLERLEKELHMNFEKLEIKPVPDLFRDEEALAQYRRGLLEAVSGADVRDRIDMGIAHLEMGLFDVAQEIFESVVRYDSYRMTGMYLLGLSLIYGGKAIEATIRLEPIARDLTMSESHKTDFLYLMGLAFERLNDIRKAREFYRRVHLLNPRYRDVLDKLK